MYNRYIPQRAEYTPISSAAASGHRPTSGRVDPLGGLLGGLGSGMEGLSGVLKALQLDTLDSGDILLGLIVLFLILEDGDNLDLIITLGLMILLSLGER